MNPTYELMVSIRAHEKLCPGFYIQGAMQRGDVVGVCSRCGEVVERPKSAPIVNDATPARAAGWEGKYSE